MVVSEIKIERLQPQKSRNMFERIQKMKKSRATPPSHLPPLKRPVHSRVTCCKTSGLTPVRKISLGPASVAGRSCQLTLLSPACPWSLWGPVQGEKRDSTKTTYTNNFSTKFLKMILKHHEKLENTMYYKRILTSMFPVLYSPNETEYFLGFFCLLDPDPGGISLCGSVRIRIRNTE